MIRIRRCATVLGGVLLATALAQATPASATSYDGKDPVSTGCSNTATTGAYADGPGFTIELRWSSGCATAWARIVVENDYLSLGAAAEILSNTDGNYACSKFSAYSTNYSSCYTPMVSDGVGLKADAFGEVGGNGAYSGWY
jgi:hypothetical protein